MSAELPVTILLSSYNGALYLAQQLDSIINQSYSNWKLIIRDDGSVDNTINIIQQYVYRDSRINLITDEKGNLGAAQSFNVLLAYAKTESYIMFCDQDDVWLPEKIKITLQEMARAEKKSNANEPVLVYTNFSYVDENLQPIQSKKNYSATKISSLSLKHLIAQNPVYGCTMMINHQLLNLTDNIPPVAENHDYWIALVASAFGKIIYLNNKTVLYRQHAANISGHHDNDSLQKRFRRVFLQGKNFQDVQSKVGMSIVFKNIYFSRLNQHQKKIVNDFIEFAVTKKLSLLKRNLNNGVRRQTCGQTFLFYFSLLFYKTSTIPIRGNNYL